jgi:pimeloyl-ACP methyl ester carboxylesterase
MPRITPTIVTLPCFSGAPWDLEQLTPLRDYELRTMRLPDGLDDVEDYVDHVLGEVANLDSYVLVGDSFGAVIALGAAVRQPAELAAVVLSGGFAAAPIDSFWTRTKIRAARFLPDPLYRTLTLRMHAHSLASPHDAHGQVPWTERDSRALFVRNTPFRSYVARARAGFSIDYRDRLARVSVPTLILTPSHDRLIGPEAARELLDGIPDAREIVIPETGHMFRFTHPETYAEQVREFLDACVPARETGPTMNLAPELLASPPQPERHA